MLWRGLVLAVVLTFLGAAGARGQSGGSVTGFPPLPLAAGQSEVLRSGSSSRAPVHG
jgi:hypothetical protein